MNYFGLLNYTPIGQKSSVALKKYISALNSYKKDKILKVIDQESACAGISECYI